MSQSTQQPIAAKTQMNSLVPIPIDQYVESLREELAIGKSDLVHLFIAYFKVNFSSTEIRDLARDMLIFGEQGLEKGGRYDEPKQRV